MIWDGRRARTAWVIPAAFLAMTSGCLAGKENPGGRAKLSHGSPVRDYGVWIDGSAESLGGKSLVLRTGGTQAEVRLTPHQAFFQCHPGDSAKLECTQAQMKDVQRGIQACVAGNLEKDSTVTATKVFIGVGCGPVSLMANGQEALLAPPKGAPVLVGKTYPYQIRTHCGVLSAGPFDGRQWDADPPLTDGNGNPPPGFRTDENLTRGTMRLLSAGRAEFRSESGMTAFFKPRSPSSPDPQMDCN